LGQSRVETARRLFPFLATVIGDDACQGPQLATAIRAIVDWRLVVVKRLDTTGFKVLPERWIVERTLAFARPLPSSRQEPAPAKAGDFENLIRTAIAFAMLPSIRLVVRRLARLSS